MNRDFIICSDDSQKDRSFNSSNNSSKPSGKDSEKSSSEEGKTLSSLRTILIVEDDLFFANEVRRSLTENGYKVIGIARNGLEAVEFANRFEPDLILMDIRMPKLDGIEAAKKINRDRKCVIPVVLITAHSDRNDIKKTKNAGILGYLVKPVSIDDIIPAVETAYCTAQDFNSMKNHVLNLEEQLKERKIIERAKDILVKKKGIDGDEAMRIMQKASRRQHIKLKDLAKAIVSSIDIIK